MLSLSDSFRATLLEQYRNAPLDVASFFRSYKACGLGECLGMCCNGGSGFYMKEEAETIAKLVDENREWFDANGAPMPEKIFDEEVDEDTGEVELSTNTREVEYPKDFLPEHFPHTACIFRDPKGACTLQKLSIEKGLGGWHYKPFACWLFPIELEHGGKPYIHVAHHSTDEYIDDEYPGFVGYTKCGTECKSGGQPAYKILEGEISALSKLLDRDLMGEILAYGKQQNLIAA